MLKTTMITKVAWDIWNKITHYVVTVWHVEDMQEIRQLALLS